MMNNALFNASLASIVTERAIGFGAIGLEMATKGAGFIGPAWVGGAFAHGAAGVGAALLTNDPNPERKRAAIGLELANLGITVGSGLAGASMIDKPLPGWAKKLIKADTAEQAINREFMNMEAEISKFAAAGNKMGGFPAKAGNWFAENVGHIRRGMMKAPASLKGFVAGTIAAEVAQSVIQFGGIGSSFFFGDGGRHNNVMASNRPY